MKLLKKLVLKCASPMSDGKNHDWAGDRSEPACWRVGGDSGVRHHSEAHVGWGAHRYEKPGKQLLPQLCHASALHHPRLPDQVSVFQSACENVWDFSVFAMFVIVANIQKIGVGKNKKKHWNTFIQQWHIKSDS